VTSGPLFLVGAQRSGTTVLAHLLSSALAEQRGGTFTVNGKLWYVLRRWLEPADLAARHLRADEIRYALGRRSPGGVGATGWLARVDTALDGAAAQVAAGRYPATADAVIELSRAVADEVAAGRPWGDKYNEYVLELEHLHAVFPSARWVMVSRHPAQVAASMLRWRGPRPWNPHSLADAEAKWCVWNARWLQFRDRLEVDSVVELDYDRLCAGPDLERLERFTELDLTAARTVLIARPAAAVGPLAPPTEAVWAALRRRGGIGPVGLRAPDAEIGADQDGG
jgi:hypothetical protein